MTCKQDAGEQGGADAGGGGVEIVFGVVFDNKKPSRVG